MATFAQTVDWARKVSQSTNRSKVSGISGTFIEDPGLPQLTDFNHAGSGFILYIIGGIIIILLVIWWLVAVWSNSSSRSVIDDMNNPLLAEPPESGHAQINDSVNPSDLMIDGSAGDPDQLAGQPEAAWSNPAVANPTLASGMAEEALPTSIDASAELAPTGQSSPSADGT
jgi:hypothetical protein